MWQAILVKKVDLDSRQAQSMMSEGARDLLKVPLPLVQVPARHLGSWLSEGAGDLLSAFRFGRSVRVLGPVVLDDMMTRERVLPRRVC